MLFELLVSHTRLLNVNVAGDLHGFFHDPARRRLRSGSANRRRGEGAAGTDRHHAIGLDDIAIAAHYVCVLVVRHEQ